MIDNPVSEEYRVVLLIASLPEFFNMSVTTLEANPDVPKVENLTEHLEE